MDGFDYNEFERELAIERRYRNLKLEEYYRRDRQIDELINRLNRRMRYTLKKGRSEIEIRGGIKREILKNMIKEGYLPIE